MSEIFPETPLTSLPDAVAAMGALPVPYFLTVDADLADFDPRPAPARLVESEALYPLLREWDTARHAFRGACRDLAALLILLTTSPKGQLA